MSDRSRDPSVGKPVPGWAGCEPPPHTVLSGRYCDLEPLGLQHVSALFAAYREDEEGLVWKYLLGGPYEDEAAYRLWVEKFCLGKDPMFYAIVDNASGLASGIASYLRINPPMGVIEVGHINYAPRLQRSIAATEAMYLMMRHVFDDLGYRRYEWKCDSLNERSRRAAARLGFTFEGIFRQVVVYKGRNRDSAWYSIIDSEWPALRNRFEKWLDPGNFDAGRHQRASLQSFD